MVYCSPPSPTWINFCSPSVSHTYVSYHLYYHLPRDYWPSSVLKKNNDFYNCTYCTQPPLPHATLTTPRYRGAGAPHPKRRGSQCTLTSRQKLNAASLCELPSKRRGNSHSAPAGSEPRFTVAFSIHPTTMPQLTS
jgi:hypothetical protein